MFAAETVYREFSNAKWNYWTYLEGRKYGLSEATYRKWVGGGAKLVTVK